MLPIAEFTNGNAEIQIYSDGTKIRNISGEKYLSDYPESIDVKLTNACDMHCSFCFESSIPAGSHGNLKELLEKLSVLPGGIEISCGGGNALSHPELKSFLSELKQRGFIPNLTVNEGHLEEYKELLEELVVDKLIYGLGISLHANSGLRRKFKYQDNVVYHLIAGVHSVGILDKLLCSDFSKKVLILGYKQFGFGVKYYSEVVEEKIKNWYMYLPKYFGKLLLSFDNLAIEQLNIKRFFTEEGWNKFYMGDDFTTSMYVNAVNKEYAPTSRNSERKSWQDISIIDYFKRKDNE